MLSFPINSPGQRLYNCLGAAAFYLVLLVVVTSYFRKRLGFQSWKLLHYTAYAGGGRPVCSRHYHRSESEETASGFTGWREDSA